MTVRALRDRGPLARCREPRAATTPQPALRQDVDQTLATGWTGTEAALVIVDVLVSRGLTRPSDEPPADRRSSCRLGNGIQFNGPEVTS